MKKMFLTMMAMMSMTLAFAENENTNSVNNAEAYDLSVNVDRLGYVLSLEADQKPAFAEIHRTFCAEMMFAAQYGKEERDARVQNAIKKDLGFMSYVLNNEQYKTYVRLLNLTLINRGVLK